MRKYQNRITVAINGRQFDLVDYNWADSGRASRAKTRQKYQRISGFSTIQIWETGVV